ncbi:MAG: HU family DNA-binding protein [Atribacterota bacterium]|nr:HU family DNA-binding protein [Atribacterota bacterium]
MNITKAELSKMLAQYLDKEPIKAKKIIETLTNIIKREVGKGNDVIIRGFGRFYLKKKAAKKGRNILKGTSIDIPEHFDPAFKAYPEFKDQR